MFELSSTSRNFATALLVLLLAVVADISCVEALAKPPKPTYGGGGGVGRFNLDELAGKPGVWQTHYDMVLVERIQKRKAPQDVDDGQLFVPDDDLPKLHLCKILSIGPGREEENGMIAPDVNHLKVGDLILAKNPWGIGPKDEELADGTKLSYMREQDIAAKVTGTMDLN